MNIKIILIFLTLFFINGVNAETLIYDNLTTSNYKYLIISDSMNMKYVNDYPYDVLFNDTFYGTFNKGDKIFYPDNTDVTIYFSGNVKTDVSDTYASIIKPTIITFLGFLMTWGLLVILVIVILYKLKKQYMR